MFDLETILKYVDIILLTLLVVILFFVLRRLLGKKVGYQKPREDSYQVEVPTIDDKIKSQIKLGSKVEESLNKVNYPVGSLSYNVDIIKSKDINFNENKFISSAQKAFELIIYAFAKGNIEEIKPFVSDRVYNYYDNLIKTQGNIFNGDSVKIKEFLFSNISDVIINNDIATIKVKFITTQTRGNEKVAQTFSEYWYFSKNINENISIWKLTKISGV